MKENELKMDIPIKKNMKISLIETVPSGYPIPKMKEQLTNMGLTCSETSEENLEKYKQEVMGYFKGGDKKIYCMMKNTGNKQAKSNLLCNSKGLFSGLKGKAFFEALGADKLDETGSYVLSDEAGGYREELSTIIFPDHFDILYKEHEGYFNGTKKKESRTINEPTATVITDTFKSMALGVTAVIQGGISTDDLETLTSVILTDNKSEDPHDYEMEDILYVFLVKGYDEGAGVATAVAGLSIEYKIHIKDYADKEEHKDGRYKDAIINITARFVSYSEVETLMDDYNYFVEKCTRLFTQDCMLIGTGNLVKVEQSFADIPILENKIVVYEKLPTPDHSVFKSGLPVMSTGNHVDSMIFYCPEFESLGYIDNLESEVDTTYSKSVTVGFETSSEVSISLETSMEMDLTIIKYGFKMGISMSMTSSYNESQTESISFTVPGKKEAYLYQGRIETIVLRYDPEKITYQYINDTKNVFHTNSVKTTTSPIAYRQA